MQKNLKRRRQIIFSILTVIFIITATVIKVYTQDLSYFENQFYDYFKWAFFIMAIVSSILAFYHSINWQAHTTKRFSNKTNLLLTGGLILAEVVMVIIPFIYGYSQNISYADNSIRIYYAKYYIPVNPLGVLVSDTIVWLLNENSLVLQFILYGISGAVVLLVISFLAKKYIVRWIVLFGTYLIIVLLLFSSNYVDLGFKYFWSEGAYCREYTFDTKDEICKYGGMMTARCDYRYIGLWVKDFRLTWVKEEIAPKKGCSI